MENSNQNRKKKLKENRNKKKLKDSNKQEEHQNNVQLLEVSKDGVELKQQQLLHNEVEEAKM